MFACKLMQISPVSFVFRHVGNGWRVRNVICEGRTGLSECFRDCWSAGSFSRLRWEGKMSGEQQLSQRTHTHLVVARGQRRMGRLVWGDLKAAVTQITAIDHLEWTTHQPSRQMGYGSRGPHWPALLSAGSRKPAPQFLQARQQIAQQKTSRWPGLTSRQDGSGCESGVNNVKTRIRHAWNQRFSLLLV